MQQTELQIEDIAYRPSFLSEIPRLLAAVALMAAGIVTWDYTTVYLKPTTMSMLGASLLALSLMLILYVVWRCFNRRLCFCNLYVSLYSGILSPKLRTSRLLYHHVRGVEIEQGLVQRLLNMGDIHVGSDNARSKAEIVLAGVRDPELVKDRLLDRVRTAIEISQNSES